jgi:glycine betaine catabolism A
MNTMTPPAKSPLLDHCPPSLPAAWYHDAGHYDKELKAIHARNWMCIGRDEEFPPLTVRRVEVAGQNLIAVKDDKGAIACFHNTCRHRGAELCSAAETRLKSKLIACPYHEWTYALDGRLLRTPYATPTADFRMEDHGLLKVHAKRWNGFVFVCLAEAPPDFERAADLGADALDNWPMADLVIGHTWVHEIACNWKIFWENFNECLHCPGIHPELCDMVPARKTFGHRFETWRRDLDFERPTLRAGVSQSHGRRTRPRPNLRDFLAHHVCSGPCRLCPRRLHAAPGARAHGIESPMAVPESHSRGSGL